MVWPLIPLLVGVGGGGGAAAATTGGVSAGTVLFYGSAVAAGVGAGVYLNSRSEATTCAECTSGQQWRVVAHAQGTDVGGTSGSTVSSGPIIKGSPVTKAEGIMKLDEVKAMLTRSQRQLREEAYARAVRYIQTHAYLGKKSFEVRNVRGGARYDVDSYGPSDNFVS